MTTNPPKAPVYPGLWLEHNRLRPHPGMTFLEVLEEDIDRFRQSHLADETTECWNWQRKLNSSGYGVFRIFGTELQAHRVALYFSGKEIPQGKLALHRCDNPRCVNPKHLFVGTQKDNLSDMASKLRGANGERNASARLSDRDIIEIRRLYARGKMQKDIAAMFNVKQTTISKIVLRQTWRHL